MPVPTAISSPWSDQSSLLPFLVAEAFGIDADMPVTAADADRIPAVQRAKSILQATIAPLPLRVLDRAGVEADAPVWSYRSSTIVSPYARMAATVLDGFYYGDSLWATERDAKGNLTDALWVPRNRWHVNAQGEIVVDNRIVSDPLAVIYFDWPGWTGLLTAGSRTIRGASAVEAAWVSKARNPVPLTVLRQTDGVQLVQSQITDLLTQWKTARRDPDGALGYLPPNIILEALGTADPELFEGARNALRLDFANYAAIPAVLLDGSLSESSLTYSTTEGNRSRLLTETVPFWAGPIEQRLSQDDIVPRGKRVRFDLSDLLTNPQSDTGASVAD
jgi:hypothetical protein